MAQPDQTLHLTPEAVWLEQCALPAYRPEAFVSDDFVHCTDGEAALLAMANRFFRGDPCPFLLLDIDLGRVTAPVVSEDPERRYPHVYAPIEREAVRRVRRVERNGPRTFVTTGVDVERAATSRVRGTTVGRRAIIPSAEGGHLSRCAGFLGMGPS